MSFLVEEITVSMYNDLNALFFRVDLLSRLWPCIVISLVAGNLYDKIHKCTKLENLLYQELLQWIEKVYSFLNGKWFSWKITYSKPFFHCQEEPPPLKVFVNEIVWPIPQDKCLKLLLAIYECIKIAVSFVLIVLYRMVFKCEICCYLSMVGKKIWL